MNKKKNTDIDMKLSAVASKLESVIHQLTEYQRMSQAAYLRMQEVTHQLSGAYRRNALKGMHKINTDFKSRIATQSKNFNSLESQVERLMLEEKTSVNEDYTRWSTTELSVEMKEVKQSIDNLNNLNSSLINVKNINVGGVLVRQERVLSIVGHYNSESQALLAEMNSIEKMVREIQIQRLTRELAILSAAHKNSEIAQSLENITLVSEQIAAFEPSQEGSSVIENLAEIPIKSHGMGKCGCGGLGRTAFC